MPILNFSEIIVGSVNKTSASIHISTFEMLPSMS